MGGPVCRIACGPALGGGKGGVLLNCCNDDDRAGPE